MDGFDYTELDPEERTNKLLALFSIALGILSLCAALIPICGAATSLMGMGLGMFGLRSSSRKMAYTGIAISILSLLLSIVYAIMVYTQPK